MLAAIFAQNALVHLVGYSGALLLVVVGLTVGVVSQVRARRAQDRGEPRPTWGVRERRDFGRRVRAGLALLVLAATLATGPGRTAEGRAALLWTLGELVAACVAIWAFYSAHRLWRRSRPR